jgi:hypothetical protein
MGMGQLYRMSDYCRRAGKDAAEEAAAEEKPTYFCMRCDSVEFRLHPDGSVHCAHCRALMSNLAVAKC